MNNELVLYRINNLYSFKFYMMKKNISKTALTHTQRERYNSILPILGKVALKVISNLKGRGRNSWKSIMAHIGWANNVVSDQDKEYIKLLDQEIDLEESLYTSEKMTQIVSGTRFKVGLPAFEKQISKQCEQELFKLLMWDDVYSAPMGEEGKITHLGYRPICRLKAD
jgi:hypothetical protein